MYRLYFSTVLFLATLLLTGYSSGPAPSTQNSTGSPPTFIDLGPSTAPPLSMATGTPPPKPTHTPTPAPGHTAAADYLQQGITNLEAGNYEQAITDFSQAIELQPDLAEAYNNRGIAYAGSGDLQQAIADYSKAIELQPGFAEAHYNRGNAYAGSGDFGQALADFNKAIELQPDYAEAYTNRGAAYASSGDGERAIADFNQAIELQPDFAEVYFVRGLVYYYYFGDRQQAIADFSQAIELKPDHAEAYNDRGMAYGDSGDFEKAIADFNQVIELDPRNADAYYNRGWAWDNQGDLTSAIADYTRAIELDPNYTDAYYKRGLILADQDEREAAIADYSKAIELQPDVAEVYYNRALAYQFSGDLLQAILDFERYLELVPDAPEREDVQNRIEKLQAQLAAVRATTGSAWGLDIGQRPLLHFSIQGTDAARRPVTVAVYPDGRQAAIFYGFGATWSPDGEWFAYFTGTSLKARNLQGEVQTIVTPQEPLVSWQPAWAPDSQRLAFLSLGHVEDFLNIVDIAQGEVVARYPVPEETRAGYPFANTMPAKFRWSPNGQSILISWGNVIVVDVMNGAVSTISEYRAAAEWAPASDAVYYLPIGDPQPSQRAWQGLFKRRLDAAEPLLVADTERLAALGLAMPAFNNGLLSLSPQGTMLALVAGERGNSPGTLWVYATDPGGELNLDQPLHTFDTDVVTAIEWAPDEQSLATVSLPYRSLSKPLSGGPVDVTVRIVPLDEGAPRRIGGFQVQAVPEELDILGFKMLSWTQ